MQTFPSPRAFFLWLQVWFCPVEETIRVLPRIGTRYLCQVPNLGARSVHTGEGKGRVLMTPKLPTAPSFQIGLSWAAASVCARNLTLFCAPLSIFPTGSSQQGPLKKEEQSRIHKGLPLGRRGRLASVHTHILYILQTYILCRPHYTQTTTTLCTHTQGGEREGINERAHYTHQSIHTQASLYIIYVNTAPTHAYFINIYMCITQHAHTQTTHICICIHTSHRP